MGLFRMLGVGVLGLGLACGVSDDSTSHYDTSMEDAGDAISYVDGQLKSRGYTTERNIMRTFWNPVEVDFSNPNEYDLHATNPVSGDEQWWEATIVTNDLRSLKSALAGTTPDIMLVEEGEYDVATLDAYIDEACNN